MIPRTAAFVARSSMRASLRVMPVSAVASRVRSSATACMGRILNFNSCTQARSFSAAAATPAPASATAAASADAEQTILVERREQGIAIVRFNRPSSLNAMTVRMGEQFQDTMRALGEDPELRVVVLTGAGTAFSAGGDLDFLLSRCESSPGKNSAEMRAFYSRFLSLLQLPVPLIAAINGPAIGAGACVASACDYRVAAKTATIGFTFATLGLHPGMGCTHFLPRIIGQQNATRLLLTGEIISGERAHAMGLVGEVVPSADQVLPAALALAARIAANSPLCMRTLTTSLRMHHQQDMERALWREADAQAQTYATPELKANVTAMKNKARTKKPASS